MSDKEYVIQLSKQMAERVGFHQLVGYGETPPKAIQSAFEKLGYKIRVRRTHTYSIDPEGDLVVIGQSNNGFTYELFYKVKVLLQKR